MAAADGLGAEHTFAFGPAALGVLALDRSDELSDPLANLFRREALPTRQRRQGDDLLLGEVPQGHALATATGPERAYPIMKVARLPCSAGLGGWPLAPLALRPAR